jgi:hypothetical protein
MVPPIFTKCCHGREAAVGGAGLLALRQYALAEPSVLFAAIDIALGALFLIYVRVGLTTLHLGAHP